MKQITSSLSNTVPKKNISRESLLELFRERERNDDLSVLVAVRLLRFSGTRVMRVGRERKGWRVERKAVER